jgi:hypothetical protein
LIQVDFADENDQTRMGYLHEELERALKTVPPEERKRFLEDLTARFPAGSLTAQPEIGEPIAESRGEIRTDKLKDADEVIRCLSEMAPRLSQEQKELAANSLQLAASPPRVPPAYSDRSMEKLAQTIHVGEGQNIDPDRLVELTILLVDFVSRLEPLVWNTWRTLSPRSSIRPSGSLKNAIGQFVSSASNADQEQTDNILKELQRLTAATVTAVGRVGGQFAKRFLTTLSPSEISALVQSEHGSVFVSHEVKCWRKYRELADSLTEDSIETEIRKNIVDSVESLVKGMGRRR